MRSKRVIQKLIGCILLLLFTQCGTETKVIQGFAIDKETNEPIAELLVEVFECEAELFSSNDLGKAEEGITNSEGYFSLEFIADKRADSWLLKFSSNQTKDNVAKYRDIAWFRNPGDTFELISNW